MNESGHRKRTKNSGGEGKQKTKDKMKAKHITRTKINKKSTNIHRQHKKDKKQREETTKHT